MFNDVFFFDLSFIENSDLRVVCYYTNWSLYREAMPTLYPDHIDPLLCTHIHYAFADINPLTLAITSTEEHDIHWTERLGMVVERAILLVVFFYLR